MASAGYKTKISLGGTPTNYGVGIGFKKIATATYQIDDDAKTIIDEATAFTIQTNTAGTWNDVGSDKVVVDDYLAGIITVKIADISEANMIDKTKIRIKTTSKFIPLAHIANASSTTLDYTNDVLDSTNFKSAVDDNGYRTNVSGLQSVSLSVSRFYDLRSTFLDKLKDRVRVLIEYKPDNTVAETVRGWFVVESDNLAGDTGSLETEELSFQLSGNFFTNFSWR